MVNRSEIQCVSTFYQYCFYPFSPFWRNPASLEISKEDVPWTVLSIDPWKIRNFTPTYTAYVFSIQCFPPSLSIFTRVSFSFLDRERSINRSTTRVSSVYIYIYLISRFDNNSIYAPCYSVYWLGGSSLNFLRSQTPRSKKMSRFFEQKNG